MCGQPPSPGPAHEFAQQAELVAACRRAPPGEADAAGDPLDERAQAAGAEVAHLARASHLADGQDLRAPSVPVFEQQDLFAGQLRLAHAPATGQRVTRRDGEDEGVLEERLALALAQVRLAPRADEQEQTAWMLRAFPA